MKNEPVIVQYPRIFPIVTCAVGLIPMGFAVATMLIPISNTKGSIIRLGFPEFLVFLIIFLMAELFAFMLFRFRIIADDMIVCTPHLGPVRIYEYSDIVRVKQRLTYKTYFTAKRRAFLIEQNAQNQIQFDRRLRTHSMK